MVKGVIGATRQTAMSGAESVSRRRDKAITKPNKIVSASVTIFAMSGALVRAPTYANGFSACQMASAGSLLHATNFLRGFGC